MMIISVSYGLLLQKYRVSLVLLYVLSVVVRDGDCCRIADYSSHCGDYRQEADHGSRVLAHYGRIFVAVHMWREVIKKYNVVYKVLYIIFLYSFLRYKNIENVML